MLVIRNITHSTNIPIGTQISISNNITIRRISNIITLRNSVTESTTFRRLHNDHHVFEQHTHDHNDGEIGYALSLGPRFRDLLFDGSQTLVFLFLVDLDLVDSSQALVQIHLLNLAGSMQVVHAKLELVEDSHHRINVLVNLNCLG